MQLVMQLVMQLTSCIDATLAALTKNKENGVELHQVASMQLSMQLDAT